MINKYVVTGKETPEEISVQAHKCHEDGVNDFTDTIVDWLLLRGIAMTLGDVEDITRVYNDWCAKRGKVGKIKVKNLAAHILKMFKVEVLGV
jgi:hypothetical protein